MIVVTVVARAVLAAGGCGTSPCVTVVSPGGPADGGGCVGTGAAPIAETTRARLSMTLREGRRDQRRKDLKSLRPVSRRQDSTWRDDRPVTMQSSTHRSSL